MRVTLARIAQKAGVSAATVDRVLNDREGVKPRTRELVMHAATQLGHFGPIEEEGADRVTMDVLLPAGDNSFMQLLRLSLVEATENNPGIELRIHEIEGFNAPRLAERLLELNGRTQAIGLVALDHPEVREAVATLAEGGVHVATLLSDLPTVRKVGYIGVDNRAAGRLAGMLVGRFLRTDAPRGVALFVGSLAYRGHEEREMGFRSILADEFRDLRISQPMEISDDRDLAYVEASRILDAERIGAIYNVGSGNQGIARALQERGLEHGIVFVGHDLTAATRRMLLERTMDAVIDQNPRVLSRELLRLLVSSVQGTTDAEYPARLQVVFRENIPAF